MFSNMRLIRVNSRHRSKQITNGYNELPHISRENPGNFTPSLENKSGTESKITFQLIGNKWLQALTRRQLIITTTVGIVVVLAMVALTIALLTRHVPGSQNPTELPEELQINQPNNDPEDPDSSIIFIPKMVDRNTWLAIPQEPGVYPLKTPVPYVVIHHTATEPCFTLADCKTQVKLIQQFHMKSNGWSDIGYNFLVGGDGYQYEGRGWKQMGAHVKGYNNVSIGIAFIGLFDKELPPKRQILAAKDLIEQGLKQDYISANYKLLAMRQLSTFKSPGQALYDDIKTWPHWSPTL